MAVLDVEVLGPYGISLTSESLETVTEVSRARAACLGN